MSLPLLDEMFSGIIAEQLRANIKDFIRIDARYRAASQPTQA